MYTITIDDFRTTALGITYYKIRVTDPCIPLHSWTVERRFRDFVILRDILKSQYPGRSVPSLPARTLLAYLAGESLRRDRSVSLLHFLQFVLRELEPDPQSVHLRQFLDIRRPCVQSSMLCGVSARPSNGFLVPEEALGYALAYLHASEIVRVSRVCETWLLAAQSPMLWKQVSIVHSGFERIQKWLMRFLPAPGLGDSMESLSLAVQFSPQLSQNLRMCLPGNMHFDRLRSFKFSNLHPPIVGGPSTMALGQELLEAFLADSSPLEIIDVEGDLPLELLKTVTSIVQLCSVRVVKLCFVGVAVELTDQVFTLLVDMLEAACASIEVFSVGLKYVGAAPSLAPDSFFGERVGHFSAQTRLLSLLSCGRLERLREFSFPFLSYTEWMRLESLVIPASVRRLDCRFVAEGLAYRFGTLDRPNRSVITDIFSAVSQGTESIAIRTIGKTESEMMADSVLTPFVLAEQPLNFDLTFDRLLANWRPKLCGLTTLVIDGPFTGTAQLIAYAIAARKWDEFVALFPKLKILRLIHCVSAIDEVSVQMLLEQLPVLEELELIGSNEKLTDTLLCKLGTLRPVRTGLLKKLTLPRTRHMSFIGMEAVDTLRLKGLAVQWASERSVSGREPFIASYQPPIFSRN